MVKNKRRFSPKTMLKRRIAKLESDLGQAEKRLSGSVLSKIRTDKLSKIKILKARLLIIEQEIIKAVKRKLLQRRVKIVKKALTRKIKSRGKTPSLI